MYRSNPHRIDGPIERCGNSSTEKKYCSIRKWSLSVCLSNGEAVLSVLVESTETLEEIRRWSHHIRTKRPVEWHELPTKFLAPDLTLCIFCEQRGHDEDWWELQKRSTKGISSYCWKWKATKHEVIETESIAEGSISTTTKNQEGAVHATTSTTSEGIGKIITWNETANSTYHISQQNLTTVKRDKMKPHKKTRQHWKSNSNNPKRWRQWRWHITEQAREN